MKKIHEHEFERLGHGYVPTGVDREELNRRLEAVKKRIDEQMRMHMFRKYDPKRPNKKTNSSKGW